MPSASSPKASELFASARRHDRLFSDPRLAQALRRGAAALRPSFEGSLGARHSRNRRSALQWSLFNLNQLLDFDYQLRKLYKQEVINCVSKYERSRVEINGELLRRFQQSP